MGDTGDWTYYSGAEWYIWDNNGDWHRDYTIKEWIKRQKEAEKGIRALELAKSLEEKEKRLEERGLTKILYSYISYLFSKISNEKKRGGKIYIEGLIKRIRNSITKLPYLSSKINSAESDMGRNGIFYILEDYEREKILEKLYSNLDYYFNPKKKEERVYRIRVYDISNLQLDEENLKDLRYLMIEDNLARKNFELKYEPVITLYVPEEKNRNVQEIFSVTEKLAHILYEAKIMNLPLTVIVSLSSQLGEENIKEIVRKAEEIVGKENVRYIPKRVYLS